MYKAMLWRVRVTIVAIKRQQCVSFFTFDIPVAVNNIKVFSVATEKQQWDSLALSPSYKIFHTAVNSTHVFRNFIYSVRYENPFSKRRVYKCGQKDRHFKTYRHFRYLYKRA
jgi:hypothetical protein